jgi:GT2 family glycosyltransferase
MSPLSVVIPTHDRLPLLRRAVRRVLADPATRELVVVETAGDPLTLAWLECTARAESRLVVLRRRGSVAADARGAGLLVTRAERALFLDDDVLPGERLVTGHARRAAQSPGAVVVGPTPPALDAARSSAAERVYAGEYARRTAAYVDRDTILRHLWAGNVSLPRALALRVGVVPAEPLGYHEDRELGLRLLAAGADAVWAPELAAAHHHRRDNREGARDARRRAAAAVRLAALHPQSGAAPTPARGLPAPARQVLAACERPGVHELAVAAMATTTEALARLRADTAEEAAYRIWRRLEEQRGLREALGG